MNNTVLAAGAQDNRTGVERKRRLLIEFTTTGERARPPSRWRWWLGIMLAAAGIAATWGWFGPPPWW